MAFVVRARQAVHGKIHPLALNLLRSLHQDMRDRNTACRRESFCGLPTLCGGRLTAAFACPRVSRSCRGDLRSSGLFADRRADVNESLLPNGHFDL